MVSDMSSKIGSSLPPRRFHQMTSPSSSPSVHFSVPPSIGRVRITQSVDRDHIATVSSTHSRRVEEVIGKSRLLRSHGASPAAAEVMSSVYTSRSSSAATSPGVFSRRYSLSSLMPRTRADLGVLDYCSVKDIDDELDRPTRSTVSTSRSLRRNNVIYTAEGARHVSPGYRSETTRASSLSRARSRSRIRDITASDDFQFDDVSAAADDDTDDVMRRRARLVMSKSRSRAMSLPRVETASSVSSSHVINRQQYSAGVGLPSTGTPRASSVTRSPGGIYSAGGSSSTVTGPPASTYLVDMPRPPRGGAVVTDGSGGWDIASYVLQPGEKFVPTDVSVSTLPSGQKAVTYTRFEQTGHGDQKAANVEIDRVIQRTRRMQVTTTGCSLFGIHFLARHSTRTKLVL